MKKRYFASLAAAAALSLGVFSGCMFNSVSVTSIEKTSSVGLVDYYTVTYSNGTTSQFTVTNGKDGENGRDGENAQSVTVQEVYDTYKKVYSDEDMTFKEFCEKYLTAENDGTSALNYVLRSCMKVYTKFDERETYLSTKPAMYCGAAVVYKMQSDYTYIVTNYHVVYDSKAYGTNKISTEIRAYLYGSESSPVQEGSGYKYGDYAIECEYIGGAIDYDVAVLRASTADIKRVNPQTVPVSVNYSYNVGDNTYAVGNPDDGGISVTEGIVSVDSDYVTLSIDSTERTYRSIRTDTALTHGNSGGGLFNMRGELIGLNNAGDEDITSMNYAIPASILTGIADGVIYYHNADSTGKTKNTYKTLLGVTSQSENSRYVYDETTGGGHIEENVVIKSVNEKTTDKKENSLAKELGLEVGDIITAVSLNGRKYEISRQYQIADLLLNARASDTIKIEYTRGGQTMVTKEMAVRPSDIEKID